jgi:hypothetical protein
MNEGILRKLEDGGRLDEYARRKEQNMVGIYVVLVLWCRDIKDVTVELSVQCDLEFSMKVVRRASVYTHAVEGLTGSPSMDGITKALRFSCY